MPFASALSIKTRDFSRLGVELYRSNHGYFYPFHSMKEDFDGLSREALLFDPMGIYLDRQAIKNEKIFIKKIAEEQHTFLWVDSGIRDPEAMIDPIIMGAHGVMVSSLYASQELYDEAIQTLENAMMCLFTRDGSVIGDAIPSTDPGVWIDWGEKLGYSHVGIIELGEWEWMNEFIDSLLPGGMHIYTGVAMKNTKELFNFDDFRYPNLVYIIPY